MKDSNISATQFLNFVKSINFPEELLIEVCNWSYIHKSPYGLSFYNDKVDWGVKPHGSLRISDHWNFLSNGKMHCETTTNIPNNTHWAIGQYDENIKKYVILKQFKVGKKRVSKTITFKYAHLIMSYKKAIKNTSSVYRHITELKFLSKYYEFLETNKINSDVLPTIII